MNLGQAARAFKDTVPLDAAAAQAQKDRQQEQQAAEHVGGDAAHDALSDSLADSLADMSHGGRRSPQRSAPSTGTLLLPALTRSIMGATAVGAGLLCLALLLRAWPQPNAVLLGLPWAVLAAAAAAFVRVPKAAQWHAALGTLALATAVLTHTAWALGAGLAWPGLSVLALLVCAGFVMTGAHGGAVVTALAAAGVLALGLVASKNPALPWGHLVGPLLGHALAVAAGAACGWLLSRSLTRELGASLEREQRFGSLLALAADTYWEIDHNYRLVSVTLQKQPQRSFGLADGLGEVPWDLPQFACDPATLDDLLADLDARQPFHERKLGWAAQPTSPPGQPRQTSRPTLRELLVSGEPRFDARGVFTGYWGVSRDVTAMRAAQRALVDTETRYHELFSRIPTPLVLHRDHVVVEANPAAARMFGHASEQDMVGSDLLAAFESHDSRELARLRATQLLLAPVGTALPVTDFRLRVDGRQVAVRGTGVRVQAQGGPAFLSIFVDDTERLATEDAVRRSEAMLSHLVATSPDLILLIEAESGRFAMVNQAFEKRSGHPADAAVGRTGQDLKLWADPPQAQQLLGQVMAQGSVADQPLALRGADGSPIPVRVSAARFVMDRRDYLVLNARDVSDSEHARMERETILTHASIGIAVTRGQRFVLANPHFESIFGWEPQALVGQSEAAMWPSAQAHDELKRRYAGTLESGQPVSFEAQARRRNGSTFTAHVRARAIDPERALEAGTAWIVEDVTERRAFEQTLARARDDAEAASRAKSAFLANTSHELRTPLNGLIGLTRLARDPATAEAKRLDYLAQISGSADALATIITDILDVSKIEAGKLLIEPTVFDLGKLLLTLQNAFAPSAQSGGLNLHFDIDPSAMGCVSGDPLRVRQIVSNFVANAIKFTAQGGVRVRVQRQGKPGAPSAPGDVVRMEVHDTGPGIDAQMQKQLFKPFSQADQSNTRRFGGTGLGLSINRELAALMGGQVGVESAAGQGSIFWAELPLPMRQPPVVHQPMVNGSSLEGMQVLMVEDNPVNMLIAVAMLERWGVQVTQAGNGRDALLALNHATQQGRHFDAVLMDIQMPVMSGHEATREMRKLEVGRRLPIIALTAAAMVNEREEAMRSGMNDFLTKPVDSEKLRSTLLRCVALAADQP